MELAPLLMLSRSLDDLVDVVDPPDNVFLRVPVGIGDGVVGIGDGVVGIGDGVASLELSPYNSFSEDVPLDDLKFCKGPSILSE